MNRQRRKRDEVDQLFEQIKMCKGCANEETEYCAIFEEGDMYMTPDEKEYTEWMCDLLCPGVEEDDGTT